MKRKAFTYKHNLSVFIHEYNISGKMHVEDDVSYIS